MNRKLALIALLVLISAIAVVELRHRNRTAFVQLQSLMQVRENFEVEWGKLLLEEGAWSQHRRIASTAVSELGMGLPENSRLVMVYLQRTGGSIGSQ
ncbi:MAG: cell division protein FtsL [Acidiferrobacterales bacterium]